VLNGTIRRSMDGGQTWNTILTAAGLYFPFILDRVNPSRLLTAQFDPVTFGLTTLQESLNSDTTDPAGPTFHTLGSGTLNGFGNLIQIGAANRQGLWRNDPDFPLVVDNGADSYDSNTIYVLTDNGLFVTKNDGQSWVERDADLPGFIGRYVDMTVD